MTNGSAAGNGSPEQDARLELRVSHTDRDRVVETLTAAAGEGLLAAELTHTLRLGLAPVPM